MRGASVLRLLQCAGVLLLLAGALILVDARNDSSTRLTRRLKRRDYYHHNWRTIGGNRHKEDILAVTTCEARCWRHSDFNPCVKTCLAKGWEKHGSCPSLIQITDDGQSQSQQNLSSPYYLTCRNECKKDSDCFGIGKCCKHHCGSTCQPAQHLDAVTGLMEIPTEIQVKPRKKKALYVKWKSPSVSACNHQVFYILEERHHNENYENNLGEWLTCIKTVKPSVLLRNFIRPGRLYQFRIASVNENGTRGFSQPITYIAQIGPRPPKAPEVIIGPLYQTNNSLYTELLWTMPHIYELPIQKYKVFWSKRLYGISALDSVLVLQHTVPGDWNKYTIHDLEPDSMYFIQVQAIAQQGKDILRGEKSGYVLNTTNYINLTQINDLTTRNTETKCIIDDLQLQKLYWSKDENDVKARLTWKATGKNIKYNISWWGSCKDNKTSQHRLTATTRHSHFDIYDLHFDCRYKVNVKETHQQRRIKSNNLNRSEKSHQQKRYFYDTSVTFTTPTCKDLQVQYKRLKCKHRI